MKLPVAIVEPFARAGYAARGVIYSIIGGYAVGAAMWFGQKKDSESAVRTLLDLPFGIVLLWFLIVGLFGYGGWRTIQSVFDTDEHGIGPKGLAIRGGLLASATTYLTLMVYALSLSGVLARDGGDGGFAGVHRTLADFIGMAWTALVLGIVFGGVALAHWWKAARRKYADHIVADPPAMHAIHVISAIGLAARGFVFAVISALLGYRAWTAADDEDKPGLMAVMEFLQDLPYGRVLLGLLGAGLLFFALYSFAEAVWRRVNVEDA